MTRRFVAGSSQALAWGKRMQKKRAQVRAAGLRTEKQFFGKRGVFARAGHTQHLKVNPRPEPHFTSWQMLIDYLNQEGWKPSGKKGVAAFGRHVGGLYQVLQLEARAWRVLYSTVVTFTTKSLGTYQTLDRALIAANRQASDYLRATKPKKNQVKTPQEIHLKTFRLWLKKGIIKITDIGEENTYAVDSFGNEFYTKDYRRQNPIQSYIGIYADASGEEFRRVKVQAESESDAKSMMIQKYGSPPSSIRLPRKNPITIVGNPPKRIRSTVAGVMYNKVWEIQAEKTGDTHKGFWYHPFKAKSDVQMLALDNGDLLIHSQAGHKLWRED